MTNQRTIYITEYDYERLRDLLRDAEQSGYRGSNYIKDLSAELARAVVVVPKEIPPDVVTMNSKVRLIDIESGEEMVFTLVFPQDASIEEEKISVLAPIGTVVLGYQVGDIIEWQVPEGIHKFKVDKILYQPEASGDFHL